MSYSTSFSNRRNNYAGKFLENLIEQGCAYYRVKGLAMIEKTPEPFLVLKKQSGGTFTGRFTGLAQPDFKGTLSGGQSIVFEAKMTAKKEIKKNVISPNQGACLDMHQQLGAIVGVCCMINKTVAFVPWEHWKAMKEHYGRQYMTETEVKAFEVPTPGFADFLKNVKVGNV